MAVKRRGGLGKGLDSLIRDKSSLSDSSKNKNSAAKSPKNTKSKLDSEKDLKRKNKPENDQNADINIQNNGTNDDEMQISSISAEEATINENTEKPINEGLREAVNEDVNGNTIENINEANNAERAMEENDSESTSKTDYVALPDSKKEDAAYTDKGDSVLILKISSVEPNREQPRKHFSEEGIEELASSIRQYGIIQPLLVQKRDDYYEIIAGERRWRAAMKAGLKEVPVIVKDYTNREAVEISLIENIQREDLNPIEEALAYDRLIQEFEMTQEQVAGRVSKSRSAVTNSLRLLKLDAEVRQMVIAGEISEGHARTLLGLPNEEMQKLLADRIIKDKLSVRETEKLVKKLTTNTPKKQKTRDYQKEAILENLSEQLKVLLGTKVSITEKGKSKGKIEIEYYSDEELNRIFEMLQSVRKIEY